MHRIGFLFFVKLDDAEPLKSEGFDSACAGLNEEPRKTLAHAAVLSPSAPAKKKAIRVSEWLFSVKFAFGE